MTVYSLDVEKYHTYIADGICTCNCIFSFSGASARNMLEPEIPQDKKIYLEQSYRIPIAVHKLATKIIERVEFRDPTPYKPRDVEGSVTYGHGDFKNPEWMINETLKLPGTSMIIVTCNYMLEDITKMLRDRGIPFSNPWRKEDKSWNPLNTNGAQILLDFLSTGEDENYWNTAQFISWANNLRVGKDGLIYKRGKAGIAELQKILEEKPDTPGLHTCRDYIAEILSSDALEQCMARDAAWLKQNVTKKTVRSIDFPSRILLKRGKEALAADPKLFVGTCHSFKGTESDNVFLYPDISFASMREMESQEGYDDLCRLFYVGVTRAKENLILMPQASTNYFEI